MLTAQDVIRLLDLRPLPMEGGYFRESYRSEETIPARALPRRYGGGRAFGTAIYYLMTPTSFSHLHRLAGDEVFNFLLGDPAEMLQLRPDGSSRVLVLGADIAAGQQLQAVVVRGTWQGSRLLPGGRFALFSTFVAPGFDHADYEPGDSARLSEQYPDRRELIAALTAG